MKCCFALALLASASLLLSGEPAKTSHHKSSSTSHNKSSAKTASGHRASRHRRTRRAAGPSYQLHPDSSRYTEIQKALADRGYFKGEANGVWGDDSVDALKRFQADQKLDADGKINSLSLIGLGLGPKHDAYLPPHPARSPASAAAPAGAADATPATPSSDSISAPSASGQQPAPDHQAPPSSPPPA